MKATLALNHEDRIALFYDEPLGFAPEWASVDVERGEIYLGGADIESKALKLDKIDARIYARVEREAEIFLIRVAKDGNRQPLEALFVPLMIARQV